jgi:tRNA-modifying protein YgfZ
MNFYTNLTNRGVLQFLGPDTRTFLQGQTTCDIAELDTSGTLVGAYCTPQGRMVCDFRVVPLNDEDCLLIMHRSICESSAAAFGKYIVFSKSEISLASDDWTVFALWGDDLSDVTAGADTHGAIWRAVDDSGHRYECYCPTSAIDNVEEQLSALAQKTEESAWQLEEINAGLGHIEAETVDMFIPQMLNLQVTGHISFSKGCYTGQEVVARMHYRGKLKRPMYIADIDSSAPAAGTPLFKADSEQSVGNIVNAVAIGDACRVLAVCTTDAAAGEVFLGESAGPSLQFSELPYSLEQD